MAEQKLKLCQAEYEGFLCTLPRGHKGFYPYHRHDFNRIKDEYNPPLASDVLCPVCGGVTGYTCNIGKSAPMSPESPAGGKQNIRVRPSPGGRLHCKRAVDPNRDLFWSLDRSCLWKGVSVFRDFEGQVRLHGLLTKTCYQKGELADCFFPGPLTKLAAKLKKMKGD